MQFVLLSFAAFVYVGAWFRVAADAAAVAAAAVDANGGVAVACGCRQEMNKLFSQVPVDNIGAEARMQSHGARTTRCINDVLSEAMNPPASIRNQCRWRQQMLHLLKLVCDIRVEELLCATSLCTAVSFASCDLEDRNRFAEEMAEKWLDELRSEAGADVVQCVACQSRHVRRLPNLNNRPHIPPSARHVSFCLLLHGLASKSESMLADPCFTPHPRLHDKH
jgi:hypothetical protein